MEGLLGFRCSHISGVKGCETTEEQVHLKVRFAFLSVVCRAEEKLALRDVEAK